MEQCVVCKKNIEDEQQALQCDLCNQWEHVSCVRPVDRPSKAMYEALTENRSKAILYVCPHCQKQGSVSKRLCKFELKCEHACKKRLASAYALDKGRDQLQRAEVRYKEEKSHIQQEITELYALLKTLGSMREKVAKQQESH